MIKDENITHLKCGDKDIAIIGTAHVSHESANLVKKAIEEIQPDTVCIELCEQRYQKLSEKKNWENMDIVKIFKEKKSNLLLVSLFLSSMQRRIANDMKIKPGQEMIQAIESAKENNSEISVVDRSINLTLSRVWGYMGLWTKAKLAYQLFFSIFETEELSEEKIEEIKQKDVLELFLQEMGETMPDVKKTLIDERDLYMIEKIRQSPGEKIVAVVGAGHVPGMIKNWENTINIEELEEKPPKSKLTTCIKWGLPLFIIGIFVLGFIYGGKESGANMLYLWIAANAICAGIGALCAYANPFTILAGMIAAPITSLNPMVAAGFVSGITEAYINKPKVSDFENLPDDILTFKGWRSNKVSKILLVAAFTNLGSSLGTFIAIPLMLKILA